MYLNPSISRTRTSTTSVLTGNVVPGWGSYLRGSLRWISPLGSRVTALERSVSEADYYSPDDEEEEVYLAPSFLPFSLLPPFGLGASGQFDDTGVGDFQQGKLDNGFVNPRVDGAVRQAPGWNGQGPVNPQQPVPPPGFVGGGPHPWAKKNPEAVAKVAALGAANAVQRADHVHPFKAEGLLEEGNGIVTEGSFVGRIPSRVYNLCRTWLLDFGSSASPPVWQQMDLGYPGDGSAAIQASVGIPCPVFGKVTGIIVNCNDISAGSHAAGLMDFIPYNATTAGAAPQTGAPQVDNLDPLNPTTTGYGQDWDDGLAVNFGDMLELWTRATGSAQYLRLFVEATFIIEEQAAYEVTGSLTPDGAGVYVRNGQYGGKPAFERVDGAYWLWWHVGSASWIISVTLGSTPTGSWDRNDPSPVGGTYIPGGTYTGTATVAARGD